jgi:phosphate transport system protein
MFENLLSFWRGKDFLVQVFTEFKDMLDDAEFMFKAVCDSLVENIKEPDLRKKIYEADKKINVFEKDIRKRIVEHLSLQPSVDVTACLLLMSVVKDAERLGDYSKNLYQVTELLEKPIDKALFLKFFDEIHKDILRLFEQTQEAFLESNDTKAQLSWDYEIKIAKRCDNIIAELAQSNLGVNQAVCFALIARYFKRLVAHLTNIATSVILPLSDLDYFDEKKTFE